MEAQKSCSAQQNFYLEAVEAAFTRNTSRVMIYGEYKSIGRSPRFEGWAETEEKTPAPSATAPNSSARKV